MPTDCHPRCIQGIVPKRAVCRGVVHAHNEADGPEAVRKSRDDIDYLTAKIGCPPRPVLPSSIVDKLHASKPE